MNREKYFGEKIAGRKEEAISSAVREALESFCDQEPEFEQAIEQSGKSFQECLKEVKCIQLLLRQKRQPLLSMVCILCQNTRFLDGEKIVIYDIHL